MGFNNGYESGYEDAKAEMRPKIKALEARIAELESGSSGGTAPSPVAVELTPPSISAAETINRAENVQILLHDASEIVEIAVKIHASEPYGPPWVWVGADYYSRGDRQLVSQVWDGLASLGYSSDAGDTVQFRFLWKADGDPDGIVRMTDTSTYTTVDDGSVY